MKLQEIHLILGEQRRVKGLAQRDVAEALNVEQATISMYETGKRGIPLDLMDAWLQLLEIEVKVTPKELTPVRSNAEVKNDLDTFHHLKKKRNYLIAELRAMMAEALVQVPEFQKVEEESGDGLFWPYCFRGDEMVGLVETRYDHPQQRYLAVEYTREEVNVYKFLPAHETGNEQSDQECLQVNRMYFSEDDFLTLGDHWDRESMNLRKMTILRECAKHPDGVEIVDPEGFPIRALMDMMENHRHFIHAVKGLEQDSKYLSMGYQLKAVKEELVEISLNNKLGNGTLDPAFLFWGEEDIQAIDVPLWELPRSWSWVEEGVEWIEDYREEQEIHLRGDKAPRDHFQTHCNENSSRIAGLVGEEQAPIFFKSNPNQPNARYRAKADAKELTKEDQTAYRSVREKNYGWRDPMNMPCKAPEEDE